MSTDFLWVEKYRPSNIEDTILPTNLKQTFADMVKTGELQNMLFSGSAGLGKTTVAKAMCRELDLDFLVINGSEEGNIDTLRGKIKQFASSVSLSGGYKVVILDEADHLNPQSTQPALRAFIEEFSDNCRFILTCNFKNRIIKPLHSRCAVYDFNAHKKDMPSLAMEFMKRLKYILEQENITSNEKLITELIVKYAPDWRRVINECQRFSTSGTLSMESLTTRETGYAELFGYLKAKDFKKMRSWVANNMDLDTAAIFKGLYDHAYDHVVPRSIPQLVLILDDYQYKDAFVADKELNTVACMTEIMRDVEVG